MQLRNIFVAAVLGAAAPMANADTVGVQIDPSSFGSQPYTINGDKANLSGTNTETLNVGQSYAVNPYNDASAGSFTVNYANGTDSSGGYTVTTTNSAGLIGTSGASPGVTFSATNVTENKGGYGGQYGWYGQNAANSAASITLPMINNTSGQQLWYGLGNGNENFLVSTDASGNVSVTQPSADPHVTTSGTSLTLPAPEAVTLTISPNAQSHLLTIPYYAGNMAGSTTSLQMLGGTWTVQPQGFTGLSPTEANFTVPASGAFDSGALNFTDSGGNTYTYEFSSPAPEPASLGFVAIGVAGLIARRRRGA